MFGLKDHHIIALQKCFESYPDIEQVIIYGSRSMGKFKTGSDIDLTIIGEHFTWQQLLHLENKLDDLLLPYKIDISIKDRINNPDMIDHINRVGKVFYSREEKMVLNDPVAKYDKRPANDNPEKAN